MKKAILAVAIIGMLLSLYAIPLHYSSSGSRLCNIGQTFNCDKVNKSPWSTFLGIPVAILGLLAYAVVFLAVLKRKPLQRLLAFNNKDYWQYLFFFTISMLLFQSYLTFAEIFWIHAYCIVCLLSQVSTIALVILSWKEYRTA